MSGPVCLPRAKRHVANDIFHSIGQFFTITADDVSPGLDWKTTEDLPCCPTDNAELGKCALEMVHINKSMCCKLNKPLYLKSLSHLHKKSAKKKSV